MNASWHPRCFRCQMCEKELADLGFIKNQGRSLCHDCNAKVKAAGLGKYICHKCQWVQKQFCGCWELTSSFFVCDVMFFLNTVDPSMISLYGTEGRCIIPIISTVPRVEWNWIRMQGKWNLVRDMQRMTWTNCIVSVAMTKWVFQFVGLVEDQLRSGSLQQWGNIGMSSTLFVPNAKSPSWDTGITRKRVWRIARLTIINFSGTCALYATKWLQETVSQC